MNLEEFVARGQAAQKAADKITARFGICRICGCTDKDCRQCIEATGEPCSWADETHTICSRCARSRTPLRSESIVEVGGSNPPARFARVKATV